MMLVTCIDKGTDCKLILPKVAQDRQREKWLVLFLWETLIHTYNRKQMRTYASFHLSLFHQTFVMFKTQQKKIAAKMFIWTNHNAFFNVKCFWFLKIAFH